MSSDPSLEAQDVIQTPPVDAPAGTDMPEEKRGFPWRLFFLLAAMMLVASVLILPYALQLTNVGSPGAGQQVAPVTLVLVTIFQALLLYFPMLLVGLIIARRLGLGAPYLQAVAERRPVPPGFRRALLPTSILGFGMGALLLLLAGAFSSFLPSELTKISVDQIPNAFQGFLASISAGINEEILLRLFLLSLLAWMIQLVVRRRSSGRPSVAILWAANILAAVIFGLLHIPNLTAMNVPVTPVILGYIILLNGMAGLGFGWLYWTFGLEAAILAHFFTDIVLHVIARMFG